MRSEARQAPSGASTASGVARRVPTVGLLHSNECKNFRQDLSKLLGHMWTTDILLYALPHIRKGGALLAGGPFAYVGELRACIFPLPRITEKNS